MFKKVINGNLVSIKKIKRYTKGQFKDITSINKLINGKLKIITL